MSGRRRPLAGGMRVVEEPIPDDNPTAADAPEPTNPGGGGYWVFIAWWFWLLVKFAAVLGLIAVSWALWLATDALWHWMGL